MKKNILSGISLLIFSCLILLSATTIKILPIGSELPDADVKMRSVNGKEFSMKELKNKNGLLVMFSCNQCPYVIKNQERTKEVCNYALQHNIGVILINSNEEQRNEEDSYEAMKLYAKEQNYSWPYVIDKNNIVADAFGANRTPECYLFNNDLKLAYHGAIDDNPTDAKNVRREHLKEAINEILSGKEVTVTESRSMGCAIKRKS